MTTEPVAGPSATSSSTKASYPKGKDSRKHPVQYSHFYPPPPVNTKYVTSSYIKTDQQTWAGRAIAAAQTKTASLAGQKKRKADRASPLDDEDEEEEEDADEEDEKTLAARTIIIHPGSTHIRVGMATDISPIAWPNVLARRNKLGAPPGTSRSSRQMSEAATGPGERDGSVVAEGSTMDEDGQPKDPLDGRINLMRTELKSIMRNMKLRGVTNGKQQAAGYNSNVQAESIPSHNDLGDEWTPDNPKGSHQVEFGARALRLPSLSPAGGQAAQPQERPWKLHKPFKGGRLNHYEYMQDFGSAAEAVLLNDFEKMLEAIITTEREDLTAPAKSTEGQGHTLYGLGIPRKAIPSHSAILIIPDLMPKYDIRALCQVLLSSMGFSQITVQQESTATMYGAGMSTACVIHCGGERTSISCVEDGLLLQETRMQVDYGGEDVTSFLYQLLVRANFPYKLCSPDSRIADRILLDTLKTQMITLDATQIGLYVYNFMLRLPGKPTKKYEVRVYDEAILAPMAVFGLGTRVIDFAGKRKRRAVELKLFSAADQDEEDDATRMTAVTGAMTASVRHLIPQAPLPEPVANTIAGESKATDEGTGTASSLAAPADSEANSRAPSAAPSMVRAASEQGQAGSTPTPAPSTAPTASSFDVLRAASELPLDVALYHSLLQSSNASASSVVGEERMKKLASNILVVGGAALTQGMGVAIEGRLQPHLDAYAANRQSDPSSTTGAATSMSATVIPPPRELDPTHLAWKGMAVIPRLASSAEIWIQKGEWELLGWKAVRDRLLFL